MAELDDYALQTATCARAEPAPAQAGGGARKRFAALGGCTFLTMIPVTLIVASLKELISVRFDASSFWTHSFMSVNLIGAAIATPLIAMLCDRAGSRVRTIALALTADAALLAAMALAPTLAAILALRAIEGVAHILALTALMSVAADHADPQKRGMTMGILGACMMFGTAAGTRLGGIVPHERAFLAAGAVSLLTAILVAATVREGPRHSAARRLSESLAVLRGRQGLAVAYAYGFVDRFCVGVIISSFVLYLASAEALPPDQRSRLLAMFLFPFAALVYPAGRLVDRIGTPLPLAAGSACFGVVMASYGFVPIGWLPAVMVLSGVLSALMFAPTLSLVADLSSIEQRGAAYAGFNAAGSLGFLLGPLIGGVVCQLVGSAYGESNGYRAAFVIAGATQVIVAAATMPRLLRLRRAGRIR